MNAEDKETLREAILEVLYASAGAPRTLAGIARETRKAIAFTASDADMAEALVVLQGLGLADHQVSDLGATKWWSITAAGTLRSERVATAAPPRPD